MKINSPDDSKQLPLPAKDVQAMKARLWEGMVPFSGRRWREKQMDNPIYHYQIFQYLTDIGEVFAYLNYPPHQEMLRNTFNLISADLRKFENAINDRRATEGLESVRLTAMWTEFIAAKYNVMVTRARSWTISRLEELRERALEQYIKHMHDKPSSVIDLVPGVSRFNHAEAVFYCCRALAISDFNFMMPMDGYEGYVTPASGPVPLWQQQQKDCLAKHNENGRMDKLKILALKHPDETNPEEVLQAMIEVIGAQNSLVESNAAETKLAPEDWIAQVKWNLENFHLFPGVDPRIQQEKWGFVVYRLNYKDSVEDWTGFRAKLDTDVGDWGEWISGSEDIKPSAMLQWIDGNEIGIPEHDIEAAKR
jgi:hypothetical protein